MKIDIYTHILPPRFFEALKRKAPPQVSLRRVQAVPALFNPDVRLKVMEQFPDYSQVLTMSIPPIEALGSPKETPALARMANDEMAELVAKHPQRFVAAVAALPLNNIEASLEEIDRAIKVLGFKGVQIFTNINGLALDDPRFQPLFERMAQYGLPIWMHPVRGPSFPDFVSENRSKYQICFGFGWPYETTAAMTHIIFSGIFDRCPNLNIITHHLGGMVPFFEQRIKGIFDQFESRGEEDLESLRRLRKQPYDYFRMFFADTAVNGSIPAMECGLAFFSSEQVLFGTDMPFDPEKGYKLIRETIRAVDGMTASERDKEKIYQANAQRLLKLTP